MLSLLTCAVIAHSVLYKRNKKYEAEETSFNMFRSDEIEMKTTKDLENGAEGGARRSGEGMPGGEGGQGGVGSMCHVCLNW